MIETLRKEWQAKIAVLIFLVFALWWIYLQFQDRSTLVFDKFGDFGDLYGVMALLGSIWGIGISRKWGFTKSIMGKAILFFSLGLFAQEFGQLAYSLYFDFISKSVPYPSIGDLGFFGSIPLYALGVLYLGKASGARMNLKFIRHKLIAFILPLLMLSAGYILFLQNYSFDWKEPIKIVLDFGYPLGQAIYISLAILVYLLSNGVLGGMMKNKVLFILFALVIQFTADYNFLYQNSKGTWLNSAYGDLLYLFSYFVMTMGLLQLNTIYKKLRS